MVKAAGLYHISINLGPVNVKFINCQNYDDAALITVEVCDSNNPYVVGQANFSIALMHRAEQAARARDVSWQSEKGLRLSGIQTIEVTFEDPSTDQTAVEPTDNDNLYVTVGYEP